MSKIIGLSEWVLKVNVPDDERTADITIHFKYPGFGHLLEFEPKERISRINQSYKDDFARILSLDVLGNYQLVGNKRRPRGVESTVPFTLLNTLGGIDFVDYITLNLVTHADKIKKRVVKPSRFFCIKMTVVIDIEGLDSKTESIEERLVLIKAKSPDDAYAKLEKNEAEYAKPYLNSAGHMVRWRIESYDDCYETDVFNFKAFNNKDGIEVYSKLKTRKRKGNKIWDGTK